MRMKPRKKRHDPDQSNAEVPLSYMFRSHHRKIYRQILKNLPIPWCGIREISPDLWTATVGCLPYPRINLRPGNGSGSVPYRPFLPMTIELNKPAAGHRCRSDTRHQQGNQYKCRPDSGQSHTCEFCAITEKVKT